MANPREMATIMAREQREIDRANQSDEQPIMFVHALWLLANSWDNWRELFEQHGFSTLAPGFPDDPETVAEARQHPDVFAGKSVGKVTQHYADIIRRLTRTSIVVGHSFGGLITQKLAGMGLAAAAVAIDPAPFRGVLPLPLSALKAVWPVLRNPGNRRRSITLTPAQYRFGFGNAASEAESRRPYDTHHVAGSGIPLFQAALVNLNPRIEASVDTRNPDRGPLLLISGKYDNTAPWAIMQMPGRGHSLTIDSGWREVADTALRRLDRVRPPERSSTGEPAPVEAADGRRDGDRIAR
jgi:non-heme chloroperoxidase